jgi:hypothetical protein
VVDVVTVTTLTMTGATVTYTVPAGVTYVMIECWGAAGASTASQYGGQGGYSRGLLVASPGTSLYATVGSQAGYNGGGAGGGGGTYGGVGGGMSDVRVGGLALSNIVIAAGGGGGAGAGSSGAGGQGGTGGGTSGSAGHASASAYGGGPGTQTTGNAAGQGGVGADGVSGGNSGGGGGGGVWGGFGGLNGNAGGGGGGGGSGFLSSTLTGASMVNGAASGDGQVKITALATAPLAPTITGPPAAASVFGADTNLLTWQFNPNDPGDYQGSANFRWKVTGAGSWAATVTGVASTWTSYLLPAATWAVGSQYEWQIQAVGGASGLSSPWSASRFTTSISVVTAPTIVTPTTGTNEYATPVALSWTLPAAFPTQDSYRVQRAQNSDGSGTLYYDSGQVNSNTTNALIPMDAVVGRTDWLRVCFKTAGHWSLWASVNVVGQLAPPQTPVVTCYQP